MTRAESPSSFEDRGGGRDCALRLNKRRMYLHPTAVISMPMSTSSTKFHTPPCQLINRLRVAQARHKSETDSHTPLRLRFSWGGRHFENSSPCCDLATSYFFSYWEITSGIPPGHDHILYCTSFYEESLATFSLGILIGDGGQLNRALTRGGESDGCLFLFVRVLAR